METVDSFLPDLVLYKFVPYFAYNSAMQAEYFLDKGEKVPSLYLHKM